jgi:hypothetical protein
MPAARKKTPAGRLQAHRPRFAFQVDAAWLTADR